MIFVFIAGTYTPIAALALHPPTSTVILVTVWIGAAGGVALKMLWPHAPTLDRRAVLPGARAGWRCSCCRTCGAACSVAAVVLIAVGGLLYTVGAIFYATRRPNTWPKTFGYHEYFHACVSLAALCHCVAIWMLLFQVR